jgi:hypothetical protein
MAHIVEIQRREIEPEGNQMEMKNKSCLGMQVFLQGLSTGKVG